MERSPRDILESIKAKGYVEDEPLDFTGADLAGIVLKDIDLSGAIFDQADLTGADLSHAKFRKASFRQTRLCGANVDHAIFDGSRLLTYMANISARGASFRDCDMERASLPSADMTEAYCDHANLRYADMTGAILSGADLGGVDLTGAVLFEACLDKANLSHANLTAAYLVNASVQGARFDKVTLAWTNFSGCTGFVQPHEFIRERFERTDEGIIAYKQFGQYFNPPATWTIEAGAELTEIVNPDPCNNCASGINVATKGWIAHNGNENKPVWKCLIPWEYLPSVVVPINSDGKIRSAYVRLVEQIEDFWGGTDWGD